MPAISRDEIHAIREKSCLTVQNIADLYGVTMPTYYRWKDRETVAVGPYVARVHECLVSVLRSSDDPDAVFQTVRTVLAEEGPVETFRYLDRYVRGLVELAL